MGRGHSPLPNKKSHSDRASLPILLTVEAIQSVRGDIHSGFGADTIRLGLGYIGFKSPWKPLEAAFPRLGSSQFPRKNTGYGVL